MASKFKVGQKVRQVMPDPVEGTVTRFVMDEKTGDIIVMFAAPGSDGQMHERALKEDHLQSAEAE